MMHNQSFTLFETQRSPIFPLTPTEIRVLLARTPQGDDEGTRKEPKRTKRPN